MTDSGTDIGARREHDEYCRCTDPTWRSPVWCTCDEIAQVRADERARAEQSRYVWVPSQREMLADLRAKVEALHSDPRGVLIDYGWNAAVDKVLALLDGNSNPPPSSAETGGSDDA